MADNAIALGARDLTIARGNRVIYQDYSIQFLRGITIILGPNGTGKTTLLESLAQPTGLLAGQIEVHGQRLHNDLSLKDYFRQTGFLPQKWSTYRGFTVRNSIEYSAWLKGLTSRQSRDAANAIMAEFDLEEYARTRVHRLSGGLQQRVGIAEALVHDPRVAFLDEPTVGLDPEQRSMIRQFLKIQSSARSIVVSTHLTDDVDAMADRVIVVKNGRTLFDGLPQQLTDLGSSRAGAATGVEAGYLEVVTADQPVGA